MDSLSQLVVDARRWDFYMGRMLRHVLDTTGMVCMAVCAGGSALLSPSGGGLRYTDLLSVLPAGLRGVVPVWCCDPARVVVVVPVVGML